MEYENLLVEITDGVAVLSFNRPKFLNALSVATVIELDEAISALAADDAVKGVIITGAGEKAFVAGADIRELKDLDREGAEEYAKRGQRVLMSIEQMRKPVIAAVNGFALGGGTELSMACHMRIASDTAKFGQPEVTLGVIPGFGGTQRLARLVGKGRAMELCLSGGIIGADEAFRIGLVNKVCTLEELMPAAEKLMRKIMAQGPAAVSLTIRAINEGLETTLEEGLKLEARLFGQCATTEDWVEGTSAFIEKRKPDFKGE